MRVVCVACGESWELDELGEMQYAVNQIGDGSVVCGCPLCVEDANLSDYLAVDAELIDKYELELA